jgi:hypothetical protein
LGRPSAARLSLEKSATAERKRVAEATRSYFLFAAFFAGFFAAFFAGFFFAAFFTALAKVVLLSVHEPNRLDPHSIPTCALTAR